MSLTPVNTPPSASSYPYAKEALICRLELQIAILEEVVRRLRASMPRPVQQSNPQSAPQADSRVQDPQTPRMTAPQTGDRHQQNCAAAPAAPLQPQTAAAGQSRIAPPQPSDLPVQGAVISSYLNKFSPPGQKIELFMSLFRGRANVFARRWESRSGKSGYSPVCANLWREGLCRRRAGVRCRDCGSWQSVPLEREHIRLHLTGQDPHCADVVGLYPVLEDNTCFFVCADFDDKNGQHGFADDALAYAAVCADWHIPCAIERSRSGNGAHVWIFFSKNVPAASARKLGFAVLTAAMRRRGTISLVSYDRFFPNQDTVPTGQFGNLVALPLQGQARKKHNSEFVDQTLKPYGDQWAFLSSLGRLNLDALEEILRREVHGSTLGVLAPASGFPETAKEIPKVPSGIGMPKTLTIVRDSMLRLPLKVMPPALVDTLRRMVSMHNPEFFIRQRTNRPLYGTPHLLWAFELSDECLSLPRGIEEAMLKTLTEANISCEITDSTSPGRPVSCTFGTRLYPEQARAAEALASQRCGVLCAATAFGKTVVAASLIARFKVSTLILVHTRNLLKQWQQKLTQLLTFPQSTDGESYSRAPESCSCVGTLSSEGQRLSGMVDIAMVQSCVDSQQQDGRPLLHNYGMVILDECHHAPAATCTAVLKAVNAARVYGLTATPQRQDRLERMLLWLIGPIRYRHTSAQQMQQQSFSRVLIPVFTIFRYSGDQAAAAYSAIISELSEDPYRNSMIAEDICRAVSAGRMPLVLTERVAQIDVLADLLQEKHIRVLILKAGLTTSQAKAQQAALDSIRAQDQAVLIATSRYAGEGFDFPRLDTLFLAGPCSWKGKVEQLTGRLHREYPGKTEVQIYDYIDLNVSWCQSMYQKRLKCYRTLGYTLRQSADTSAADSSPDLLCNSQNFSGNFLQDLEGAKQSVLISSPQLTAWRTAQILPLQQDLLRSRGVRITVVTCAESPETARMRSYGISVLILQNCAICAAVIDKVLFWHGSIQILGDCRKNDCMLRMRSPKVSAQLTEAILQTVPNDHPDCAAADLPAGT